MQNLYHSILKRLDHIPVSYTHLDVYKRQVLSRLNAFLDSELEQVLCFDSTMNAERFAAEKSAIFLILPEEDQTKNFMAGLMIQTLARELFAVADENGGRLPGRVVFFCDELGTMPAFDILPLFSAGRSRGLTMVPIKMCIRDSHYSFGSTYRCVWALREYPASTEAQALLLSLIHI